MATAVRVSDRTRARAAALASDAGTSIGELVDRALDTYESREFWTRTRQALEAQSSSDGDVWDAASRDGLDVD